MRILLINAVFGYSSTGTIVKFLFENINMQKDEPTVLCMDSTLNDDRIINVKKGLESHLHAGMSRLFGFQGFWSYFSSKRIIRKIRKQNPDIIHIHNLHSNFINLPLLLKYCARHNKPLVVTLHDCWYFTGKCYHFEDVGCQKWKQSCGQCPKRKLDIPSLLCDSSHATFILKKKLFNNIKKLYVVGCSRWITNKAKSSPVFRTAEFLTIYNGVDTSVFNHIGNLSSRKRPFTIMVMANKWFLPENARLRRELIKMANAHTRLKIVGCNIRQLAENVTSEHITYIGYVNGRDDLANHYRESDVFLNVTFIDTLPTVNMEAICCGTPVITYHSGGSPELVEEGVTGYVVKQNDIEGIIGAIKCIQEKPLDRVKCAEIGKQYFDKDINFQKYINLYNHIHSN